MKMAPALVRLYEEMPEPKYVIAMGACTITGGMFSSDSTTAVRGVDKLIPVDVYIPVVPRPEAIIDAIIKLRKKVANESLQERGTVLQQTNRYYSTTHKMQPQNRFLRVNICNGPPVQAPPKELLESHWLCLFPPLF
jgi:NAD(P)H-quinone oxidoreductase subunit K